MNTTPSQTGVSTRNPAPYPDMAGDAAVRMMGRLLQFGVVGLLIAALLFQGTKVPVAVQGLFVLLLSWLIGRTSAAPLLMAFQLALYLREPRSPGLVSGAGSLLFVATVLGLLMFLSRDRVLRWLTGLRVSDVAKGLWVGVMDLAGSGEAKTTTVPSLPESSIPVAPVVFRQGVVILLSLIGAQLLLAAFPVPDEVLRGQRSRDDMRQMLASATPLMTLLLVVVTAMSYVTWRKLTSAQASLYARSTFATLLYPDLRIVARYRIRERRRKQKK